MSIEVHDPAHDFFLEACELSATNPDSERVASALVHLVGSNIIRGVLLGNRFNTFVDKRDGHFVHQAVQTRYSPEDELSFETAIWMETDQDKFNPYKPMDADLLHVIVAPYPGRLPAPIFMPGQVSVEGDRMEWKDPRIIFGSESWLSPRRQTLAYVRGKTMSDGASDAVQTLEFIDPGDRPLPVSLRGLSEIAHGLRRSFVVPPQVAGQTRQG